MCNLLNLFVPFFGGGFFLLCFVKKMFTKVLENMHKIVLWLRSFVGFYNMVGIKNGRVGVFDRETV